MCGRFAQPRSADELARIFHARVAVDIGGERYNVAPTDPVTAIVEAGGERLVDEFRWGLIPSFAASAKGAARLINARSETAETSPAFRASFRRMRCIVPADAFYEWRREPGARPGRRTRAQPFAVRLRSGEPMAFAALWAAWRVPDAGDRLHTVSILTGPPNELVSQVHDRMPIVLEPDDWATWLSPDTPVEAVRPLLRPLPAEAMRIYPVSPAVNDVRSDGAGLLEPVTRWQAELWPA